MLRRDYILNQIEEIAAFLAKILGFSKKEDWQNAFATADEAFQYLVGVDVAQALAMSETELFARLIENEPTHRAENKIFALASLFQAAGEVMAGQDRAEESRQHYLKGLKILLDASGRTDIGQRPDFGPAIETFCLALQESPLPAKTQVLLMRHYEQAGELAKAEDALFALAETTEPSGEFFEFGESFYRRLKNMGDDALIAGNFSRPEVEAGLASFRKLRTGDK